MRFCAMCVHVWLRAAEIESRARHSDLELLSGHTTVKQKSAPVVPASYAHAPTTTGKQTKLINKTMYRYCKMTRSAKCRSDKLQSNSTHCI